MQPLPLHPPPGPRYPPYGLLSMPPPLGVAPPTDAPVGSRVGSGRVSGIVVVMITLAGAAILLLNVVLLACFIKRRASAKMRSKGEEGLLRELPCRLQEEQQSGKENSQRFPTLHLGFPPHSAVPSAA